MVVMLGNTNIADTAMLASSWLKETAGAADLARPVKYVVIWISPHLLLVVFGSDYGRCRRHTLVSKYVGQATCNKSQSLMHTFQAEKG